MYNKTLSKCPSFRPFGGGRTYCPERYLAEREVLTFVAVAICRFDLNVVNQDKVEQGSRFPRIDKKKFCLGIMEPVKGDDVIIDVKERKRCNMGCLPCMRWRATYHNVAVG